MKVEKANNFLLSEKVPFKILLGEENNVAITYDGGLLATIIYECQDHDLISATEHESLIHQIDKEFKLLIGKSQMWSVYAETKRVLVQEYETAEADAFGGKKLPLLIDFERASQFSEEPHYVSMFYITLKLKTNYANKPAASILNFIAGTGKKNSEDGESEFTIDDFNASIDALVSSLDRYLPMVSRLAKSEFCQYLHSTINSVEAESNINFITDGNPIMFLGEWLTNCSLESHHAFPKIIVNSEYNHFGYLTIRNLPSDLAPVFSELVNHLSYEVRYYLRFVKISNEILKAKLSFRRNLISTAAKKTFTSSTDELIGENYDVNKINDAVDAKEAENSFNNGENFGHLSATFVVWDKDIKNLKRKMSHLEEVSRHYGIILARENFQATSAYFGSIPGEDVENLRSEICSFNNFLYLMPLTSTWAGSDKNFVTGDGKKPPLMYAVGRGKTPVKIIQHPLANSPGHTAIMGMTGGGKSTLLILIALQWAKYGGDIFYFDKGRTSQVATVCSGGNFFDFSESDENSIGIQPIGNLDSDSEIGAAQIWINELLNDREIEIDPKDKADINKTLILLSKQPKKYRTLSTFQMLVQSESIKLALVDYVDGPYSHIFNSDKTISIENSSWNTFEIGSVLGVQDIARPLLRYLMMYIDRFLNTDKRKGPTLIIIDEKYNFLKDPYFKDNYNTMLRDFRKRDATVVSATQAIYEILSDKVISAAIVNNVKNFIFLPSQEVKDAGINRLLKEIINLNDFQIEAIANAQPQKEYVMKLYDRLSIIDLNLGEIALAFCGTGSNKDIKAADALAKEGNLTTETWLKYKNASDELLQEVDVISQSIEEIYNE